MGRCAGKALEMQDSQLVPLQRIVAAPFCKLGGLLPTKFTGLPFEFSTYQYFFTFSWTQFIPEGPLFRSLMVLCALPAAAIVFTMFVKNTIHAFM